MQSQNAIVQKCQMYNERDVNPQQWNPSSTIKMSSSFVERGNHGMINLVDLSDTNEGKLDLAVYI